MNIAFLTLHELKGMKLRFKRRFIKLTLIKYCKQIHMHHIEMGLILLADL